MSLAQFAVMPWLATAWAESSVAGRIGGFAALTVMMTYNIIVLSHLFTHAPWFVSARLNALVSVLNSVNIGQSVQAYELSHVRNHHRYNNDRQGPDGSTKDLSSTYLGGKDGEHAPLFTYAVGGAFASLAGRGKDMLRITRLWRVGSTDVTLLALASSRPRRRTSELRQIQADRVAVCLSLAVFAVLSWQWTVFCYLPAFLVALAMVNVQNYYRHYGANPGNRAADSASFYGRFYNFLAFNDGYHQEHHLNPSAHWSQLPSVRVRRQTMLSAQPRIISTVPAIVGFLDRRRPMLHEPTDTLSDVS